MLGEVYSQLFRLGSGHLSLGKAKRYRVMHFTPYFTGNQLPAQLT